MTKRVCVTMTKEEYILFKRYASEVHKFAKGYTTKAGHDALVMWYHYKETHEGTDILLQIAKKKYPNLIEQELIKKVFEEAAELYLKENEKYLD
jgi:hypothetical protein